MEKSSFTENKRVSAIKELLRREGLKQKELALLIDISKPGDPFVPMEPQNLSRVLTSGKVSEKLCRKINDLFPDYRLPWLLGYDDYPTEADKIITHIREGLSALNSENIGFIELAKSRGYTVTDSAIIKDGRRIDMTTEKMNRLQSEVSDFLDFLLSKQFQK